MGTVSRTGLAGLLIVDRAENGPKQLECSLPAVKPAEFDAPVTL